MLTQLSVCLETRINLGDYSQVQSHSDLSEMRWAGWTKPTSDECRHLFVYLVRSAVTCSAARESGSTCSETVSPTCWPAAEYGEYLNINAIFQTFCKEICHQNVSEPVSDGDTCRPSGQYCTIIIYWLFYLKFPI